MQKANEDKAALWRRRYEDYKAGGLTRRQLSRHFKVKLSTLDYWFARVRPRGESKDLVELKGMGISSGPRSCLTVVMAGGIRVEIPRGCDVQLLGEVIGLLGKHS